MPSPIIQFVRGFIEVAKGLVESVSVPVPTFIQCISVDATNMASHDVLAATIGAVLYYLARVGENPWAELTTLRLDMAPFVLRGAYKAIMHVGGPP